MFLGDGYGWLRDVAVRVVRRVRPFMFAAISLLHVRRSERPKGKEPRQIHLARFFF
jgi:hypothetical protein